MSDNWLFVGDIPLQYPSKSVAKQFKIEFWLDCSAILKDLGLQEKKPDVSYIR